MQVCHTKSSNFNRLFLKGKFHRPNQRAREAHGRNTARAVGGRRYLLFASLREFFQGSTQQIVDGVIKAHHRDGGDQFAILTSKQLKRVMP